MAASLRFLPASLFAAVMGLAGLGLAWRGASAALPLPAPLKGLWIWVGEGWMALAALAFACLVPAYALKALRHPQAVREELTNPALLGFCAALPVGMTLLAGGLQTYSEPIAQALWWAGVALLLALQLRMLERLARGGTTLAQVNGGWMIVLIGGIVVPGSGIALGHAELSRWLFGFSALAAPFVMGLVLYRMLFGPPMPDAAKPGWFIVLVPPALIYLNGAALSDAPAGAWLEALFLGGLALAAALFVASRGLRRWPFGAPWWAFTFPLDALASAAGRYARDHPAEPWLSLAAALLALAAAFVVWVLVRTLAALARGTLFKPA